MNAVSSKLLVLTVILALNAGIVGASEDMGNIIFGIKIINTNFVAQSPEKENLNQEWIEISNQGSESQSLEGWTLSDSQKHTYVFKNFTLKSQASVKVHTGVGDDTATDLYWNRKLPVWNNDGDEAILMDASGNMVAQFSNIAAEA